MHSDQYGPTALHDTAVSYGLAKPTRIPIGNEAVGFMPDAATEKARHRETPCSRTTGCVGDGVSTAIGQGDVLVTPLQLANAYNTFANHGTVYQPQVVARILKPGGNPRKRSDIVLTDRPDGHGHVSLPPNVYDPILQGLQGVVSQHGGTAFTAFQGFDLTAFPLAGKTGTAQVTGKGDTSLFASFGPVGHPQYTIVAVLEESGFGADAAAPVVRHVWETVTGQRSTQVHRPADRGVRLMALSTGRPPAPSAAATAAVATCRRRGATSTRCCWCARCSSRCSASSRSTAPPDPRAEPRPERARRPLVPVQADVVRGVGFVAMLVVATIDYRKYRDWVDPDLRGDDPVAGSGRVPARVERQRGPVLVRGRPASSSSRPRSRRSR